MPRTGGVSAEISAAPWRGWIVSNKLGGQRRKQLAMQGQPQGIERTITRTSIEHTAFQGPIPAPADLEKYERIVPGLATRLIAMAESEAQHRRECDANVLEMQRKALESHFYQRGLGQVLGFAIVVIALAAATVIAIVVQTGAAMAAAATIGGASLAALIYAYMHGRKVEGNEIDEAVKKAAGDKPIA